MHSMDEAWESVFAFMKLKSIASCMQHTKLSTSILCIVLYENQFWYFHKKLRNVLDAKKNITIFKKLINSIVEANAFFIAFIVVHSYVHRYSQGKSVWFNEIYKAMQC